MKTISKVTILLTVFLFSCSKSGEPTPAKACLLSKMTSTSTGPSGSSVWIETFDYNSDHLLIKHTQELAGSSSPPAVYTYTYTDGEISKTESSYGTSSSWAHEGGRVKSIAYSASFNVYTTVFEYDGHGRLSKWTQTNDGNAIVATSEYSYDGNGNITSNHHMVKNGAIVIDDLTSTLAGFDTKQSPYLLLAQATSQPYFHFSWDGLFEDLYLTKSNPSSYTSLNGAVTNCTYTYNSSDYPATSTEINSGVTTVTVFDYINCD